MLEIADEICPIKNFSITKRKPTYITNEILEMIKERDTVMRLARAQNYSVYWQRGQNLIKEVVRAVSQSKKEFIINQLEENRKDSRKFWKSVKLILPDKNLQTLMLSGTRKKKKWCQGL